MYALNKYANNEFPESRVECSEDEGLNSKLRVSSRVLIFHSCFSFVLRPPSSVDSSSFYHGARSSLKVSRRSWHAAQSTTLKSCTTSNEATPKKVGLLRL